LGAEERRIRRHTSYGEEIAASRGCNMQRSYSRTDRLGERLLNLIEDNERAMVIGFFCFIALWRFLIFLELNDKVVFTQLAVDSKLYFNTSKTIVGGDWLTDIYFTENTLYPYLIAIIHVIAKVEVAGMKFVQMAVGIISIYLAYAIAREMGGKFVGYGVLLISGFYREFIFHEFLLLTACWELFFNLLFLYVIIKGPKSFALKVAIAGFVLGLNVLIKPSILLILPFFLWYCWSELRNLKQYVKVASIFVGVLVIMIFFLPFCHLIVKGDFPLPTSNAGLNLYLTNHPGASPHGINMPPGASNRPEDTAYSLKEHAEKELGKSLSVSEASAYMRRQVTAFIFNQPVAFLKLLLGKAYFFFHSSESYDNLDPLLYERESTLFRFPFLTLTIMMPLALIGILWHMADWRRFFWPYSFVLVYFAIAVIFTVVTRYRLPVVPFIIIFAVLGFRSVLNHLKKGEQKKLAAQLVILPICFVFSNFPPPDESERRIVNNYSFLGRLHMDASQTEKAIRYYEYAKALSPRVKDDIWINLGKNYFLQGDHEKAEQVWLEFAKENPDYPMIYNNLGILYWKKGEFEKAVKALEYALSLNPELPMVKKNLAKMYQILQGRRK